MKHKFSSVNQPSRESKKVPKKKTIAKLSLLTKFENVEDAREEVLEVYADALRNGTKAEKFAAAKELAKYLFPTKQNVQGNLCTDFKVVFENIKDEQVND